MVSPKILIALGVGTMVAFASAALWLGRNVPSLASKSQQVQVSPGAIYAASFTDLAGAIQPLGRWQQKLLVINFWATWCGPCKKEMPILAKIQQKYGESGLQIVGIAIDSSSNVSNFAQKELITYPLLMDELKALDLSRRLGNRDGLLPYTVVIAPGGNVIHSQLGAVEEDEFELLIIKMLQK